MGVRRRVVPTGFSQMSTRPFVTGELQAGASDGAWPMEPMLEALGDVREWSPWTWSHLGRVARYAMAFGRELGMRGDSLLTLHCAAILHDVGKILVPPELLDKSTPLEPDEWYTITKHPVTSSKMLRAQNLRIEVVSAAQSHHEWYNGKGYPLGLAGEAIPIAARVLSIADSYDAMSSDRPYRAALSPQRISEEIAKGAGVQFDPGLIRDLMPLFEAGVETSLPRLRMRVISDDPALFGALWFGAFPLGWDLEVWPYEWSTKLKLADEAALDQKRAQSGFRGSDEGQPDLTIVDGKSARRLAPGMLEKVSGCVVWIDPLPEQATNKGGETETGAPAPTPESDGEILALYRPLDLENLHAALNASLYEGTEARRKRDAIRVLIADPYQLFRQVLCRVLEKRDDVRVVCAVATSEEYREALQSQAYDVALVASDLLEGTRSTAPLSRTGPLLDRADAGTRKPTLVLVADEDLDDFADSDETNRSYIHRGAPIEELVEALVRVIDA